MRDLHRETLRLQSLSAGRWLLRNGTAALRSLGPLARYDRAMASHTVSRHERLEHRRQRSPQSDAMSQLGQSHRFGAVRGESDPPIAEVRMRSSNGRDVPLPDSCIATKSEGSKAQMRALCAKLSVDLRSHTLPPSATWSIIAPKADLEQGEAMQ